MRSDTVVASGALLFAKGFTNLCSTRCGRGGTGRRATLRSLWANARGSSSLLDRTKQSLSLTNFYLSPCRRVKNRAVLRRFTCGGAASAVRDCGEKRPDHQKIGNGLWRRNTDCNRKLSFGVAEREALFVPVERQLDLHQPLCSQRLRLVALEDVLNDGRCHASEHN